MSLQICQFSSLNTSYPACKWHFKQGQSEHGMPAYQLAFLCRLFLENHLGAPSTLYFPSTIVWCKHLCHSQCAPHWCETLHWSGSASTFLSPASVWIGWAKERARWPQTCSWHTKIKPSDCLPYQISSNPLAVSGMIKSPTRLMALHYWTMIPWNNIAMYCRCHAAFFHFLIQVMNQFSTWPLWPSALTRKQFDD